MAANLVHGAVTSLKGSVTTIENDLTICDTRVTALNKSLAAFPTSGGSLDTALDIHKLAQDLNTALITTTNDVKANGPVGLVDGTAILTQIMKMQPTILSVLGLIVTKKPAFDTLPQLSSGSPRVKNELAKSDIPNATRASQVVKHDLVTLNKNLLVLETAIISLAPAALVGQAKTIQATVNKAFDTTIAAYGGV